uniref:Uncharacterized protein n=1 Tax=Rhizophagus irregularis (strain DAOM 181602 / DAOM 197198 / MUCL 43194) TaxID=747089 RepID=U9UF21_RHIID
MFARFSGQVAKRPLKQWVNAFAQARGFQSTSSARQSVRISIASKLILLV